MKTQTAKSAVHASAPSVAQRREAMPVVSAFIDLCRQACGTAVVDKQLAIAQKAWREHALVLEQQGRVAADRWLIANAHRCTFFAQENGRTLGLQSPYGRAAGGRV